MREYINQLEKELSKFNIKLTDKQICNFSIYLELLMEWNKKINLTSIVEPNEILTKHFVDSLSIAKWLKDGNYVIDVGSGAGFPGIPLSILMENCSFLLVDSLNKRVKFLDEVINKLKLKNTRPIDPRADELAHFKEYREMFDIATSRAVANMSTLLEYLLPFCKVNGLAICMKGNNIKEELIKSKNACHLLKGNIEKIDNFYLPFSEYERNVIIVRKMEKISEKYPRRQGKPAKEPIQ